MAVKLLMNSGEIYFKYIASYLYNYAAIAIYYTESLEDVCRFCGVGEDSVAAIGYVARIISAIFFAYHITIVFGT